MRESQSPSLRGSGRFNTPAPSSPSMMRVSIPFIAGQWSLQVGGSLGREPFRAVSIPFIAGQWSLRGGSAESRRAAMRESQSPSLRGNGRFVWRAWRESTAWEGLNPLHCGAVVASHAVRRRSAPRRKVSIPFIAGQWSLLAMLTGFGLSLLMSQSPSLRGSGRFPPSSSPCWRRRRCLNPLHCGAVVASCARRRSARRRRGSQSPSLRGSGRFHNAWSEGVVMELKSQSPSLRGSGRF